MEELEKRVAELKDAMTPEAINGLTDEELENLKSLLEKLKSMIDGTDEIEDRLGDVH